MDRLRFIFAWILGKGAMPRDMKSACRETHGNTSARQIMADVFDTLVTRHRGEDHLAPRAAMVGALSANQSVARGAAANHLLDTTFPRLAKSAKGFWACFPAARGHSYRFFSAVATRVRLLIGCRDSPLTKSPVSIWLDSYCAWRREAVVYLRLLSNQSNASACMGRSNLCGPG